MSDGKKYGRHGLPRYDLGYTFSLNPTPLRLDALM